jgi:hypothetical protein
MSGDLAGCSLVVYYRSLTAAYGLGAESTADRHLSAGPGLLAFGVFGNECLTAQLDL